MEKEFSRRLWESVVHECEPLGANGVVVGAHPVDGRRAGAAR
jgi:hypothetical protein